MTRGPERSARILLAASLLAVAYADFHSYVLTFYANPDAWGSLLRGSADAPEQYRVGIVQLAAFLARATGLRIDHAFTLIDAAALFLSGFLLLRELAGAPGYRRAARARQWFGLAGLLFLVQFYLAWLLTPQRPETLSATLLVVLMAFLLTPYGWSSSPSEGLAGRTHAARRWAALVVLGVLGILGCSFRPDVVFALGVGLALSSLEKHAPFLTLRHAGVAAAGVLLAGLAVAAHLYLARVVYPAATYGRVKMWQLRPNFIHPDRWLPFLIFMLPLLWTVREAMREPRHVAKAQWALLFAALVYFLLWITVGKLDEVRLMLPFALPLAPLTMELAMLRLDPEPAMGADDVLRTAAKAVRTHRESRPMGRLQA